MIKYANNPVFWTNALVLLVTLAGVNMRSPVVALDLAALYFLVWLGFRLWRSSYAQKHEIFLPRPDGVSVCGPEGLAAMPFLYLLADVLISLVSLVAAWNWPGFWTVLVIAAAGGLLCARSRK